MRKGGKKGERAKKGRRIARRSSGLRLVLVSAWSSGEIETVQHP
jgi:hypothetical protein